MVGRWPSYVIAVYSEDVWTLRNTDYRGRPSSKHIIDWCLCLSVACSCSVALSLGAQEQQDCSMLSVHCHLPQCLLRAGFCHNMTKPQKECRLLHCTSPATVIHFLLLIQHRRIAQSSFILLSPTKINFNLHAFCVYYKEETVNVNVKDPKSQTSPDRQRTPLCCVEGQTGLRWRRFMMP